MSQVQRNEAYFCTQVDAAELERLVGLARVLDPHIRDAFHRVGIRSGDKVIDVGCGPIGALLALSDMVGPEGTVVGLDMDELSLQQARSILDRNGLERVQLVHANINEMPATAVCPPGPFDVALCRALLNNQKDPAETLRRIAAFVRPGGHIVVQSPLFFSKLPRSEPEVPALGVAFDWAAQTMQRMGASPEVGRHYHALCQAAGLKEVSQRGFFDAGVADAGVRIRIMHDAMVALRAAIVKFDIASDEEVESVLQQLKEAETWEFQTLFFHMLVELIAQVP